MEIFIVMRFPAWEIRKISRFETPHPRIFGKSGEFSRFSASGDSGSREILLGFPPGRFERLGDFIRFPAPEDSGSRQILLGDSGDRDIFEGLLPQEIQKIREILLYYVCRCFVKGKPPGRRLILS